MSEISGSQGGKLSDYKTVRHVVMKYGRDVTTFRINLAPPSTGHSSIPHFYLYDGAASSSSTLVLLQIKNQNKQTKKGHVTMHSILKHKIQIKAIKDTSPFVLFFFARITTFPKNLILLYLEHADRRFFRYVSDSLLGSRATHNTTP